MFNPQSLKILIILFLISSTSGPDKFRKILKSSSRYMLLIVEVAKFEHDLTLMIKNIHLRNIKNDFKRKKMGQKTLILCKLLHQVLRTWGRGPFKI